MLPLWWSATGPCRVPSAKELALQGPLYFSRSDSRLQRLFRFRWAEPPPYSSMLWARAQHLMFGGSSVGRASDFDSEGLWFEPTPPCPISPWHPCQLPASR